MSSTPRRQWLTGIISLSILSVGTGAGCACAYWRYVSQVVDLIHAVYDGDQMKVKHLLKTGADVNGSKPDGFTPLMRAVSMDDPEMVKLLLAYGAKVGKRDARGRTVFDYNPSPRIRTILEQHRDLR